MKRSTRNRTKNEISSESTKNDVVEATHAPQKKRKKEVTEATMDLESVKNLKPLEDPPKTSFEKKITSSRLPFSFFDSPSEELAKRLLGKILVRKLDNGTVLKGRIVETESYLGGIDKASATYELKVTPRNIPLYMVPGTIFVYMTYGMYHCINISSQGDGSAVLLRAVEPLDGIERITDHRLAQSASKATKKPKNFQLHELCNGPSKLCMGFQLDRSHNKYSICTWKGLWVENDVESVNESIKIVECPRIGIDRAGIEWSSKPLRFYIYDNKFVSKRDKKAEMSFEN